MLAGTGPLFGELPVAITLTNAPPGALMLLWISLASTPFPVLCGTVHAVPFASELLVVADAGGSFSAATTWPAAVPPVSQVWFQFVVQDASSIYGITLSSGLLASTP